MRELLAFYAADEGMTEAQKLADLHKIALENIALLESGLETVDRGQTGGLRDPEERKFVERACVAALLEPAEADTGVQLRYSPKRGRLGFVPNWKSEGLFTGHMVSYTSSGTRTVEIKDGFSKVSYGEQSSGTRRIHVLARNQNRRDASVEWIELQLGKGYNWTLKNRKIFSDKYNCSQLAWASYMYSQGLDIDINEGSSVLPDDMRRSTFAKAIP